MTWGTERIEGVREGRRDNDTQAQEMMRMEDASNTGLCHALVLMDHWEAADAEENVVT